MYTQFSLRWYSACKNGSKKHRNTRRNAAFFLFESKEYYCITAIKSSKFQSIFGIFGRHFVGFLVIVAVRAPLWIPRGPKRAPKAAQRRFGDQFLGFLVSFWGPGGSDFGGHRGKKIRNSCNYVVFLITFCGPQKMSQNLAPQGGWTCNPSMPVHVS